MNVTTIEAQAKEYRDRVGGHFFVFPVEPDNPRSKYAFAMYDGKQYHIYGEAMDVEEAAASLKMAIEAYEEVFKTKVEWDRDVRFISTETQVNSDSVTMRRLRNSGEYRTPEQTRYLVDGVDVTKNDSIDGGYAFSARGLIKFMYLESGDTPKAAAFMDKYYQLLGMRKYGATASHIKREVKRMSKDDAVTWIEKTYTKYIHDDMEIFNIMQGLTREE